MLALSSFKRALLLTVWGTLLAAIPSTSFAQDSDADDPPPEAGRISYVSGNVSIQPVTADEWGQAYPNLPLGPGDRIFTDANGRAEVQIGQTYVRIGPNSDVTLVDDSQFNINFGVAQGSIRLHSFSLWPRQLVDISTPNGNAEFGNQGDIRIDVLPNDGATVFTNLGQFADITAAGNFRQELNYGQSLELAGSNPVYPQWLQPAGQDDLDAWARERDQRLAQVASFNYVSPDIPGAADLDAYGDWQPQTEYGAVWFPRNVSADWRPYHNGHWINRNPWGWVWVEDEPWGYAPFHYGRWVVYSGRWGWVPGPVHVRPVWSPALVVFAGGGNLGGGISAWFPLGPGEAYRPWYRCGPRYIDQVNITNIREAPRVRVERTYVNVVNVTNVTYVNKTYVTAVRRDDFASGRRVRDVAVRVDPREMQHVRPLPRPIVAAPAHPIISRPVAHPVPVSINRPVLINQQGKQIEAKPGAAPVAPPVRQVPPVRQLPGRTIVAAPAHPVPDHAGQQNPNQVPAVQGNQQQQRPVNAPYQPIPSAIPRANPVAPVPGIQHDLHSQPGDPPSNANQPRANPKDQRDQQPAQPSSMPMTPPDQQQQGRPNQPQPGQPNYQPPRVPDYHEQNRPNQPIQQQNQPVQPQPNQPNYQAPRAPDYHEQNRPNQPIQQRQNQPVQPQPNQPNYHQHPDQNRPNLPQNPPPVQRRQDQGQPSGHRDEAPPAHVNNVQPNRQMNQERPMPQPQMRQAPPPQPNHAEQQRPQQQPKVQNEVHKENKDQKNNDKDPKKPHN
jgi:hypothetical protein